MPVISIVMIVFWHVPHFLGVSESLSDTVQLLRFAEHLVGTFFLNVLSRTNGAINFSFFSRFVTLINLVGFSSVVPFLASGSVFAEELLL